MQNTKSQRKFKLNFPPSFIVGILLFIFLSIAFFSAIGLSPTYDEARNYNYGKSILNGDSNRPGDISMLDGTRIDGSMMAASALNALPFKIASFLADGGLRSFLESILTARLVTILFSVLVAWLVFRWSRTLHGFTPAIFSLLLYIFDPNIIAHSQLVTTDLYAWGSTLLVFYCSWKFAKDRTWQNGLLWGFSLGISSLAKYTTIILIPLSLLSIFIYDIPKLIKDYKENHAATIKSVLGKYLSYFGILVFVSILIINIGFLFNKSFMRFGEYKFYSHLLQGIQSNFPWLENVPVPVPFPYVEGFDLTYYYGEEGLAFGNTYLLGELRDGKEGFKGYYVIASFFKTPIAIQLIIIAAFYLYISNKERRESFFTDDIFLLLPVLFFFIYFNFFFSINIGIRYYLVMFPLLFVFCGSLFKNWEVFTKTQKNISSLLIVYLIFSNLSYFPNYMPYFNEFLPNRKMAYKILADSNIDYGQSEDKLKAFLESHPDVTYNPTTPTSGLIVAGVNDLVGVFGKPEAYAWLRENFEPDDTIAYTYLVYNISQAEIDQLCETTNYCD